MSNRIRCVYCKVDQPRPKRGEHIILAGLGGRATIPDACDACNARLSALDREFLRNTHIALHRFFGGPKGGAIRSPQFLPCEFGFLDICLLTKQTMDILPQLARVDAGILIVAAEPDQLLVNQVAAEIASGATIKVHRAVKDVAEHVPARLVVDRKRKSHLLRASNELEADRLWSALLRGLVPGGFSPWDPPRDVRLQLSLDVNVPGRCAAKMAFNMACAVFGAEAMLDGRFDPVCAYILGEDVLSGSALGPGGELGAKIDYRFVEPWMSVEQPGRYPKARETHSIVLGSANGMLTGYVLLFGGLERFTARLGELTARMAERLPIDLSCRPRGDWWVPLHSPHLTRRHGEDSGARALPRDRQ